MLDNNWPEAPEITGLNYLPLNMEAIHIIKTITTITDIMPTTAPALNMPDITEQLLKQSKSKMKDGKYNLFIVGFW